MEKKTSNNAIYVLNSIKQMAHENEQFISDAHFM